MVVGIKGVEVCLFHVQGRIKVLVFIIIFSEIKMKRQWWRLQTVKKKREGESERLSVRVNSKRVNIL